VITASAGNHAQGLALAANRMGLRALIVMPETTPSIKVEAVRSYGGEVVLHGDTFDVASVHAQQLAREQQLTYVHPYDDPDVIAGQATVGQEILRQYTVRPDAIFVPVGGGGLIAGIALAVKAVAPDIRIIGVEPDDAACLKLAMDTGERGILAQVGLFVDGVAVRQVGEENFRIARQLVDDVITCSADEICAAVRDIFEDNRSLPEPAGALALAGLKKYAQHTEVRDECLIAIESGANVNFDRLRHIAERAEIGEHGEALLAVTIQEQPGSLLKFCALLGRRAVTEFNYRSVDAQQAHLFLGVKLSGGVSESEAIVHDLREKGIQVLDMSDNDMAKMHVRYMIGGPGSGLDNEQLFRFEFPERPGALLAFLNAIGVRWNISMFHYRNHGAAYGRVLVGIQVPESERAECLKTFDELAFEYAEETSNPAYRLLLGGD
jgi:threonine dehydratase